MMAFVPFQAATGHDPARDPFRANRAGRQLSAVLDNSEAGTVKGAGFLKHMLFETTYCHDYYCPSEQRA
jgi:hypothetical protein